MREHLRLCGARRIRGDVRFELLQLRRHRRELRLERARLRSADVMIGAKSDRLLLEGCASGRLALELQGPLGKLLLRRGQIRLRFVELVTKDAAQTAALTAMQLVYAGERNAWSRAIGRPMQLLVVDRLGRRVEQRLRCQRASFGWALNAPILVISPCEARRVDNRRAAFAHAELLATLLPP